MHIKSFLMLVSFHRISPNIPYFVWHLLVKHTGIMVCLRACAWYVPKRPETWTTNARRDLGVRTMEKCLRPTLIRIHNIRPKPKRTREREKWRENNFAYLFSTVLLGCCYIESSIWKKLRETEREREKAREKVREWKGAEEWNSPMEKHTFYFLQYRSTFCSFRLSACELIVNDNDSHKSMLAHIS